MTLRTPALVVLLALACAGCQPNNLTGVGPNDDQMDGAMGPSIYEDFPAAPIIDNEGAPNGPVIPPNIADLFGSLESGAASGGPCVMEPEPGSLIPYNWLRLRYRVQPVMGQNVFEIRMKAPNQLHELRVYTTRVSWVMPPELWRSLTAHSLDMPIRFSVRGAQLMGAALTGPPALGQSGQLTIAPAKAEGSIVYWTTAGGTGFKGFGIGEEKVRLVYDPPGAGTGCVGCHASTPDGDFVAFSAADNSMDGGNARLDLRSADGRGRQPAFLTDAARSLLARKPQHGPTFARPHWVPGDRTLVSMFPVNNRWEIIWTNLEAGSAEAGQGWGVIPRIGDGNQASAAMLSHDGRNLVYVSAPDVSIGVAQTDGDIAVVPYNGRAGGAPAPVMGASDPNFHEYYPVWAPDDSLIAFDRAPKGQTSVNNGQAEVYVVPGRGGAAVRLRANDPPQCSGKKSPGITNSWPRWAPETGFAGGRRYYFLTFSSTRAETGTPQLYMAPLMVDETGVLSTYPALPLWNQPEKEGNHTPAWDAFRLVVQ